MLGTTRAIPSDRPANDPLPRPGHTGARETECRGLLEVLRGMELVGPASLYQPGNVIYRESEYGGQALYVLVSGIAKLFSPYNSGANVATLMFLRPWDIFGYPAFTREMTRRAQAEAVTECEVIKIPTVFIKRAIRQQPQVALKLVTLLDLRLVRYEELVNCLLPRETEARLANLLPILAQSFGEREGRSETVTIDLHLTHWDLAAMVAATRESVTTALVRLRGRGLVEKHGGRIFILKLDELAEIGQRPYGTRG